MFDNLMEIIHNVRHIRGGCYESVHDSFDIDERKCCLCTEEAIATTCYPYPNRGLRIVLTNLGDKKC